MTNKQTILRTIALLAFGVLVAMVLPSRAISVSMSDYCSVPPFLTNAVSPNIMIMMDNSGSMNEHPYGATFNPLLFVSRHYYGYFDPTKMYQYISASNRWQIYSGTTPTVDASAAQPIASGNLLNWAVTRKIEVAKGILVGGDPGVIGTTANSRTVTAPNTVKLYTHDPGNTYNANGVLDNTIVSASSTTYGSSLVPGFDNVIYPFLGNYTYKLQGGGCSGITGSPPCSALAITFTGATTVTARPVSNHNSASPDWTNWLVNPSGSSHFDDVNETNQDGNNTYIYNRKDTLPALFNYNNITSLAPPIQDVSIVAYVRKRAESTGNCGDGSSSNPWKSRNIQAVLRWGDGTITASAYQTLIANDVSDYNKYIFTWTVNPKTGAAWQWGDLKSDAASSPLAQKLTEFGIANHGTLYNGTTNQTCYPRFTQVYLYVDAEMPSGGPYSLVVDTGKQSISGLIDQFTQGTSIVRFGLAQYNTSEGGRVLNPIDFSNSASIADKVIKVDPGTWTPLGETEYELLRYFRQQAPVYSSSDFSTGVNTVNDPYYFMYTKLGSSSDRYVPCAKSYILLLTDGEPTQDSNYPSSTITDANSNGSKLDEFALWGRTSDMRPGTCSGDSSTWTFPCVPGVQNVYTYPIFLFGKGSTLLKETAINGSYEGTDTSPPCKKPSPTQDDYKKCYRFASDNTSGTIDPATDPPIGYFEGEDAYELQASITEAIAAIMKRAGSGTAVSVLTTSSRGVGSMQQAYFLPRRQEGAREVIWTGYTQNLWLDPDTNIREDTIHDYDLNMSQDDVIKIYFDTLSNQTMAASFTTDASGYSKATDAGSLASCTPKKVQKFSDVTYLWEGGDMLARKRPGERNIFTSTKVVKGAATVFNFAAPANNFTVTNISSNASLSAALNPDSTYTSDKIVQYIRGECLETGATGDNVCGDTANSVFRDRRIAVSGGDPNGNVWKLGDIITSTPQVLSNQAVNVYDTLYGDLTYNDYIKTPAYSQRSAITFIGANDGMLHAFRVGYLKDRDDPSGALPDDVSARFKNDYASSDNSKDKVGEEVWAYIPFNSFPYLKYFANPDYCHLYYNDLPATIVDVSIGDAPNNARLSSSWRTILIGGMRFGAACDNSSGTSNPPGPPPGTPANVGFSSFYALDITDVENPTVLWEFSDQDMGYASSYPAFLRTGSQTTNGNWYIAFGTGSSHLPKTGQDLNRTTSGYIYVLDVRTGNLVQKIKLDHNAIVGNVVSLDGSLDYSTNRIYFGTSYKSGTNWFGKIASIDIPNQDLAAGWAPSVRYLFTDAYPFTAAPDFAVDESGTTWVFAGSGKYESDIDQVDTSQQVFIGFKDKPSGITYPINKASLDNRTNTVTTGQVTQVTSDCLFDSSINSFSTQTYVTSVTTSSTIAPSNVGWYINLQTSPSAERVISKPLAYGGIVDFLTFVPNSDVCSAGGTSYLCAVEYNTGIAPAIVALLTPEVTSGQTTGTVTVKKCVPLGFGAPPKNEAIIIPPTSPPPPPEPPTASSAGKVKKKSKKPMKMIQTSTGAIPTQTNNPPFDVGSKIIQWLKK